MKVGDDNSKCRQWFLVKVQENYLCLNILITTHRTAVIKTSKTKDLLRKKFLKHKFFFSDFFGSDPSPNFINYIK